MLSKYPPVNVGKENTMINAYKEMWKRAGDFKGITWRSSYWLAQLTNLIILFAFGLTMDILENYTTIGETIAALIFGMYFVAAFIPSLSITIRRLRDTGRGWGYIFFSLFPILNIVLIIFLAMPSVSNSVPFVNNQGQIINNQHPPITPEQKKANTRVGIIVAIVVSFFILLSIGVLTMVGMEEKERLEENGLEEKTMVGIDYEVKKEWSEKNSYPKTKYTNGGKNSIVISESELVDKSAGEECCARAEKLLEKNNNGEITEKDPGTDEAYYQVYYETDKEEQVEHCIYGIDTRRGYYQLEFMYFYDDESITFDAYSEMLESIKYIEKD